MELFFSVGEPSGDVHGANLIRALRQRHPQTRCVGYGGPRMQQAGCHLHADLTRFAVMWFLRVLIHLHHFYRMMKAADRYFAAGSVDAVVLIDYPGFNWWIARCAKKHGIPVFYYGAPQMWAWAGWRIGKMRRLVDHVLCKLPFEEQWYGSRGCRATYVGHPFFDETQSHCLDELFVRQQRARPERLVTILPGSRMQEVSSNLPWFLRAAGRIRAQLPQTRFAIAAFNERQAEAARQLLGDSDLPVEIHVGKTPELIAAAECCLACSGSVSLQLLSYEKPSVILYHISRGAWLVQGIFRQVKYITLVNLLAARDPFPGGSQLYDAERDGDEVPFPEYLTCTDRSEQLARHVVEWLTDAAAHARCVGMLQDLKIRFARSGASQRAAEYIVQELQAAAPLQRAG